MSAHDPLRDARREAREMLEWLDLWRAGEFAPAHTSDGWTVEMHGLADSVERIALALLEATEVA